MPIAHSLKKVAKNVSKHSGQMHIKGRKFKQLNRATLRDQKLTARKRNAEGQRLKDLEVVRFFQAAIQPRSASSFLLQDIKLFVESFLSRFDEELATLKEERRAGRPPLARQQKLEQQIDAEKKMYHSGLKVPDIRDKLTVENLRNWNGSPGGTTVIKFFRVTDTSEQSLANAMDE